MSEINPGHIEALIKMLNGSPYFELLSMRVLELKKGYSKVEIDTEKKHLNPFGGIHGGAYASFVDTASYLGAYCEFPEGVSYTTLDLTVSNLGTISGGKVIAEGRSIKIGKTVCLTEAHVRDEKGRLLAHGTSKLLRIEGAVNRALDAAKVKMPPKFLD